MSNYNIRFTDSTETPIEVEEYSIDSSLDIDLPGRIRLEWGEEVNQNFLRLLENFACPRNETQNAPDLTFTQQGVLENPITGQPWFDTTNNVLNIYNGSAWVPYSTSGLELGANWGQIMHGEQLPLPISPDGYEFSYEECIWSVSPFSYLERFNFMNCYSNAVNSEVTMQYRFNGSNEVVNGIANYLIIGIRGNVNLGGGAVNIPEVPINGIVPPPSEMVA